jgi:hypothetical protein
VRPCLDARGRFYHRLSHRGFEDGCLELGRATSSGTGLHSSSPRRRSRRRLRLGDFSFGRVRIDGVVYDHDVVIDRGVVRKRKKKASKKFRAEFGHTPVSLEEKIPWKCRCLVIGTGRTGGLPVMEAVILEAKRRGVKLTILPTDEAIGQLEAGGDEINAILHLTC